MTRSLNMLCFTKIIVIFIVKYCKNETEKNASWLMASFLTNYRDSKRAQNTKCNAIKHIHKINANYLLVGHFAE